MSNYFINELHTKPWDIKLYHYSTYKVIALVYILFLSSLHRNLF